MRWPNLRDLRPSHFLPHNFYFILSSHAVILRAANFLNREMPDEFQYDVFLSHSAKDKAVVRPLAERLRKDGVKVWFDEWVLKPGDSIPAKIEEGLERSRVLVLCMSANTFGSDWAQLESGTFRFRDPLNKERRCPSPGASMLSSAESSDRQHVESTNAMLKKTSHQANRIAKVIVPNNGHGFVASSLGADRRQPRAQIACERDGE